MDLKDIQGRLKELSYENEIPVMETKNISTSLTNRIIKRDRKDRKILMFGILVILSAVVFYGILSYRCIHFGRDLTELYFYGFISAAFLSILPFCIHKYRQLGRFDYSEDTLAFLEKTEKRFRFPCNDTYFLIPLILLFDVAMCCFVIFRTDFLGLSTLMRVLTVQVLMIPYLSIPIGLGYLNWRKKKRPILLEIQEVRKQFVDASSLDS